MTKQYDRAYFDKWYRRRMIVSRDELRRKVLLAVVTAEYFLRRPLGTVLDIGCGEGAWHPVLRMIRKDVEYTGIDSSDYAIEAYGETRGVKRGRFADLRRVRGSFDLVVCSDVLHYLGEREIRAGLEDLVRLTDGVAFLEVLTKEDDVVGDLEEMQRRPARWYRRLFSGAGLTQVGPYCWLSPKLHDAAAELEIAPTSSGGRRYQVR
jgi:cyclopropane fatty-acyl-phospholipid synthase-like methyltransferase